MKKTLIKNGLIITVNSSDDVWLKGWVLIEDGIIKNLGEGEAPPVGEDCEVVDASGKAVLPGFVNVHSHVCGTLFKGIREDVPKCFYNYCLPLEKLLTPQTTYSLSMVGAAEALLAGITCTSDIYHFMCETARAVKDLGMRGVLASKIIECDLSKIQYNDYTRLPAEADKRIEENVRLIEEYHNKGNGRITCKFGPHATDTVTIETAKRIKDLGDHYGVGFHTHVAQKPQEVNLLREQYNLTPVEYLVETGLMGESTVAAHCAYVTENDIRLMAEKGLTVAHCGEMNGKAGSNNPVKWMYQKEVNMCYGTDWLTYDPWTNMRSTIMVDRVLGCSLDEVNAHVALRKSTIEPANHLGLGDKIGSLEAGKRADLLIVNYQKPRMCPLLENDPVATLVYNANGADVETVMVDGEKLVENGVLLSADMGQIVAEAQKTANALYRAYQEGKREA